MSHKYLEPCKHRISVIVKSLYIVKLPKRNKINPVTVQEVFIVCNCEKQEYLLSHCSIISYYILITLEIALNTVQRFYMWIYSCKVYFMITKFFL